MCVWVRQSVASAVSSTRHPPLAWLCAHSPRLLPLRSAATHSQCANICIFKLVVVVELVVALLVVALPVAVVVVVALLVVVVVLVVAVVVHCCSALLKQPQNS